MKKLLSSPEVIAAMITVFGTLLVGIILGVAEGKIGFTSLLAVVATLALLILVYLLYKRSGARVTALAGLIMLVVGFAGFSLLRPRTPTTPTTPTPTVQVAARPTVTPVPPATSAPTKDAPAAPTRPPTATVAAPKPPPTAAAATRTPAPAPTAEPGRAVTVPDALIGVVIPPGPEPVAVAFADSALWVADNTNDRLYQLDAAGAAVRTIVLDRTEVRGLAWDGQDLLVATGDWDKPALVRFSTAGVKLESTVLPLQPIGLGWNPADSTLWTSMTDQGNTFLVHLTREGDLIEAISANVFGGPDGLTCGPDGLWVTDAFGDVSRFSYSGVKLAQSNVETTTFPEASPAVDSSGNLYLASGSGHKIYQFSTRLDAVGSYPTPMPEQRGAVALPGSTIEPLRSSGLPRARITNSFAVPLTVSIDKVNYSDHEAAVIQPGETWTVDVQPGIHTIFASTSGQGMVMFWSRELLVKGYSFTWVLSPPQ